MAGITAAVENQLDRNATAQNILDQDFNVMDDSQVLLRPTAVSALDFKKPEDVNMSM